MRGTHPGLPARGALPHVLWIGGAPASGKTTVALRLARRYGLRWYGADTRTWIHRDRALRAGIPAAQRFEEMTYEQRWERSTPEQMLQMSLHEQRGPMVLDDLAALPTSPLVVAEGTTLPASALSAGIVQPSRAVWLLPTRQFQRAMLAARGTGPGQTALYLLLAETIGREAREHGARTITIDGRAGIDATVAAVEELFAEALAEGPGETGRTGRRALLREANEAVAGQVRGYYAQRWAVGDAEAVVYQFVCECGEPACEAVVALPVRESVEPVFAPGHAP